MKRQQQYCASASLILVTMLTACGGGSGSGGGDTPTPPPQLSLSGTVATGTPFGNANISVLDKNNTEVARAKTASDGSYDVTLPAGATPPFVLKAVRDDMTLVGVAASDSATANITPITTLIASRLSPSGDPDKLAAELKANPALLDGTKVEAKVEEVTNLLKPLLAAVDAAGTHPLTGKFKADGTGIDHALDALSITITPSSATSSNIEVAVRQQAADGEQPKVVSFTNATAPTQALTVDAAKLPPRGTSPLIDNLLQRLTACFALPAAERVARPDSLEATASDIKADACKQVFYNNDPTLYRHGGKEIGISHGTVRKSFSPLFQQAATGVVFDRGTYEYTRENGDYVVAYRSVTKDGSASNDTFVVRPDDPRKPTRLSMIGDQNKYEGSISPYHQYRDFLRHPALSYYNTGYLFDIPNNGTIKKVIATGPGGIRVQLFAGDGFDTLNLAKPGTSVSTATPLLKIRAVYADPTTAGNPTDVDTGQVFTVPQATEAEIADYPAQSAWTFEYYTAIDSDTPVATQYQRTRARPLTIAELRTQQLATLTSTLTASLTGKLSATGLPLDPVGPLTLEWLVPDGALEPTNISLYGRRIDQNRYFNDKVSVKSNARSGKIACALASAGDTHCSADGNFVNSEGVTLNLWARDPLGREFARNYSFYQPGN
ncbi:MAG: carboxypeptidase-like regulatory domain-containing protein [Burkholderiaceae bacterium]